MRLSQSRYHSFSNREMSSSRFLGRWKSCLGVSLGLGENRLLGGRGGMKLWRWWGECEGSLFYVNLKYLSFSIHPPTKSKPINCNLIWFFYSLTCCVKWMTSPSSRTKCGDPIGITSIRWIATSLRSSQWRCSVALLKIICKFTF